MCMNHEAVGSESGILILSVEEVSEWESDSLKLGLVSVSHLRDGDGGNQIGCYCLSPLLIFPDPSQLLTLSSKM